MALIESQFANELPHPLAPGFIFQARGSRYEIGTAVTEAEILGSSFPTTTVWGYKNNLFPDQGPTYPGRTFVANFRRGSQVRWTNDLPPEHLLPVDTTVHWADPEGTGRLLNPSADPRGLESVIVTHVHGGRNQTDSDGLPEYWFGPDFGIVGPRWTKRDYVYPNEFEARTLWYHDHALGITRLNVYAGLAGFYILRDNRDTGSPDNPLNLPAFPYEVPIVIQDRCFDADGQLLLPAETVEDNGTVVTENGIIAEFFGDVIVVNGKAWPHLNVEPRNYRLRFLNGSDSRFYILKFQDEAGSTDFEFHVIGTDQGLLFEPVERSDLLIGPGERYDVVFDFDQAGIGLGAEVFLRNFGPDEPFGGFPVDPGDAETTGQIMRFDVVLAFDPQRPDNFDPTAALRSAPIDPDADLGTPKTIRRLGLFEGEDNFGRLLPLLGAETDPETEPGEIHALTWQDSPTENPGVGDVEQWEIYNTTEDTHPIHLHLVRFQIVNRESFELQEGALADEEITLHDGTTGTGKVLDLSLVTLSGDEEGPEDYEAGWKDTAVFPPGHVTRIRARFDRPGRYVWHCHILSHEDHEMMRPYYVGPIPPGE